MKKIMIVGLMLVMTACAKDPKTSPEEQAILKLIEGSYKEYIVQGVISQEKFYKVLVGILKR